MNKLLQLFIFDCDGVLFDSKEANRRYYNNVLAKFNHPPMNEEQLSFVHTHHVTASIQHLFHKFPDEYEQADIYRKSIDYTHFLQYMLIEPDLIQFLEIVKPQWKTAISTNRTTTMRLVLEQSNLTGYFDKVVTAMDVANPKPHPEALHKILDHFQLAAENAIFIGDSQVDRDHAASCGMRLIAYKNKVLDADFHVTSFLEILNLPIFK